jgi:glutamyl/glutaminyl-tRNA synthetase
LDTSNNREKDMYDGNIEISNQENEMDTQEEEMKENENDDEGKIVIRRTSRTPRQSTRLRDYVTYKIMYPIQDFVSYRNIFSSTYGFYNLHIKGTRTK